MYPKDKNEKLQFANALCRLKGMHEGELFIEVLKRERDSLRSQLEKVSPDSVQITQGRAQQITNILDLFDEAPSVREKLRQKK